MPYWDYLDLTPGVPLGSDVSAHLCVLCMRCEILVFENGRLTRRMYLDDTPVLHKG